VVSAQRNRAPILIEIPQPRDFRTLLARRRRCHTYDVANLADDLILPQFLVHCNTMTQLFSTGFVLGLCACAPLICIKVAVIATTRKTA
jgi:hypothetical protein